MVVSFNSYKKSKAFNASYCSKSRTNHIRNFQSWEPTDGEESNTKTASINAYGGQGPSNIFL